MWMAAFEECATFTCFVSVFTCRTRLFGALKEKKQACISNYTPSECTAASLTPLGPAQGEKSVTVDTIAPVRRQCVLAWRGRPVRDRVPVLALLRCCLTLNCLFSKLRSSQRLPTPRFIFPRSTLNRLGCTKAPTDVPCSVVCPWSLWM